MATPATCHTCVYAQFDRGLWLRTLGSGFPAGPICANHPDTPGLIRECRKGFCRNYRRRPPTPTGEHVRMIPLSDGLCTYVDADNFEWLSQYKWCCQNGYAARREKRKVIFMHRQIMQPPPGMVVDHINGNRLDNTRANMHNVTPRENTHNTTKRAATASLYKGVTFIKSSGRWRARIWFGRESLHLGTFATEIEAARAYDRKAVELGIEFAWLNFPEEWPARRRARVYRQYQAAAKREGKKQRKGRGEKSDK